MYFFSYLCQSFQRSISSFALAQSAWPDDGLRAANDNEAPKIDLQVIEWGLSKWPDDGNRWSAELSDEAKEAIKALQEQLDTLKAAGGIVKTDVHILGNFLEKVAAWDIEGCDPSDTEFIELMERHTKKITELQNLSWEAKLVAEGINAQLGILKWDLEQSTGEDIDEDGEVVMDGMWEEASEMPLSQEEQEELEELESLKTQRDSLKWVLRLTLRDINIDSDEFKNQSDTYKNIVTWALRISSSDYVYQNLDSEWNPIDGTRESIIREIEHLENTNRELNVLLNNNTPEWETTLSEAKDQLIQEKFLDLKQNGTEIQKEIIGNKWFLDLSVADFQRLQLDGWVDLSEWFLRPSPNNNENSSEWSTFTVHFGWNLAVADMISSIIPIHIDSIVLDGRVASRMDDQLFGYDRWWRFTVLDGSEIIFRDVNREVRDNPELLQERLDDFREQMASNVNRDTFQRQANNYIQSIDTVWPENEDGWFMTMFKKVMNGLAVLQWMDPIFEEVLEKEEPYYNSYSQEDNDRIREQWVRRFIPNGNELLRDGEFMSELSAMCDRLWVQRDDMLIVMQAESRLDPTEVNQRSWASWLIQFMPDTAEWLWTSVEAIRNMSAVEQLVYVEKYFGNYAWRMNSVADIYRVVFYPVSIWKSSDWVLGSQNGTAQIVADQNWPWITQYSRRSDGLIDNATFDRYVEAKISQFSTVVTPPSLAEYENRDITQPIRDLDALEPSFRSKVDNWLSQVRAEWIDIKISETLRTQARQNYLYEQWRTRSWNIITWTRRSNHKTGQAIDIYFNPDTHGSMYPPVNWEPWVTTARLARENWIDWWQDLWWKDGAHFQDNRL
jgi:RNAse (barnase) inhibitor barstar